MPSRHEVLAQFIPYIEQQLAKGILLSQISRNILDLFHGVDGARAWRRYFSEHAHKKDAGIEVIKEAAKRIH